MKQSKNLFKILAGVGGLAIVIISLGFVWKTQQKEKDIQREDIPITILSQNIGAINSENPLEFKNQLEVQSQSSDFILAESARKMLEVNRNIALNQSVQTVKMFFYKKHIVKIIKSVFELLEWSAKDPIEIADDFLNKKGNDTLAEHFLNEYNKFRYVHKYLAFSGKRLPSPIFYFYDKSFLKRLKEFLTKAENIVDLTSEGYFTEPWIEALKPHLLDLYIKMKLNPEDFVKAVINYYLFQHYILYNIYSTNAIEAFIKIVEYNENINENRDKTLAQGYIDRGADFISLQEAGKSTINELCDKGYIITEQDRESVKNAEGPGTFGSINLYKKSFIEKNNYTITEYYLTKEKVKKYRKGIIDRHYNKLFSNEVNINKLENEHTIIMHMSFHADSKGSNTKVLLQGFFELVNEIKESTDKKVCVIACLDGNLTIKNAKNKLDLETVIPIIKKAGCKIIEHEEEGDVHTTKKERSNMQLQLNKSGLLVEDRSDILIVSNNIKIVSEFLDNYTELSDHRSIGANIVL